MSQATRVTFTCEGLKQARLVAPTQTLFGHIIYCMSRDATHSLHLGSFLDAYFCSVYQPFRLFLDLGRSWPITCFGFVLLLSWVYLVWLFSGLGVPWFFSCCLSCCYCSWFGCLLLFGVFWGDQVVGWGSCLMSHLLLLRRFWWLDMCFLASAAFDCYLA